MRLPGVPGIFKLRAEGRAAGGDSPLTWWPPRRVNTVAGPRRASPNSQVPVCVSHVVLSRVKPRGTCVCPSPVSAPKGPLSNPPQCQGGLPTTPSAAPGGLATCPLPPVFTRLGTLAGPPAGGT